jgi:hypothetical protein
MGVTVIPPGVVASTAPGASVTAFGNVTNPGAGSAVAITGALPAGTYRVSVNVGLGGTTAAADACNMQIQVNAGTVATLLYPSASGIAISPNPDVYVTVPAGGTISVNCIGAPTATAVYRAQISATRVGP